MFVTRLVSGIILVILAVLFIYSGGIVLSGVLLVLSLIGSFELLRVFGMEKSPISIGVYFVTVSYYVLITLSRIFDFDHNTSIVVFLILMMLFYLGIYVFNFKRINGDQVIAGVFIFMYVPFLLSFIFLTRSLSHGIYTVWLIILTSWGCDTFAYCAGMLFGKHKMSPVLSPKKSVEGAVGGILGAMVLSLIFFYVFKEKIGIDENQILVLTLLAGLAAFASMIGDLAASAFKRNYKVKDYGRLIPGHGGVLDRFDSVIVTAPIVYILALFI